jgi:hypothetical protein
MALTSPSAAAASDEVDVRNGVVRFDGESFTLTRREKQSVSGKLWTDGKTDQGWLHRKPIHRLQPFSPISLARLGAFDLPFR